MPFQILYPAATPGTPASYVPYAAPLVAAFSQRQGRMMQLVLGRIGGLAAPWSAAAPVAQGGALPVILYLPGATGYMQMGSFQTTAPAAQGFVVVTLNQPGAVSAAVMPDGSVIPGLTREQATQLIAPSYRPTNLPLPAPFADRLAPQTSIVPYFAADVALVLNRLVQVNAAPRHALHTRLDLGHVGLMGLSLGAIVTAQACATEPRVTACLMMDAPVPLQVTARGLRQKTLRIARPADDQRAERTATVGWPEPEIAAQARSIDTALSHSDQASLIFLHGLFHVDFTDLPAVQPLIGWLGQSSPAGYAQAQRQINDLTKTFFAAALGPLPDQGPLHPAKPPATRRNWNRPPACPRQTRPKQGRT